MGYTKAKQQEQFVFDITRQLIQRGGEDEDIWQLSVRFKFAPTEELRGLGKGNKWCPSPNELKSFEEFLRQLSSYSSVRSRSDGLVEIEYQRAG